MGGGFLCCILNYSIAIVIQNCIGIALSWGGKRRCPSLILLANSFRDGFIYYIKRISSMNCMNTPSFIIVTRFKKNENKKEIKHYN